MNTIVRNALVALLTVAIAAVAFAGERVEIRFKDGSRWRGEISDTVQMAFMERGVKVELEGRVVGAADWYITLETHLAGEVHQKTIFKSDILSMRTIESAVEPIASVDIGGTKRDPSAAKGAAPGTPGVFVLPLKNTVGIYLRHEEMEAIAEEADKYGPGQIIVFIIDSPGGLVTETETIHATLMEIKKRHRLVAWIKEAISAACATALHCDEIYFMTEGSAGAMTAYAGQTAWKGEELKRWLRTAGEWAEAGGRPRYIAEAMIHAPELVSYDKDPDTGEVTWHDDLSGEFVLSDEHNNLVFTATQAVHCGFADGIADTEKELAEHLDLEKWHEVSDYGRRIAKDWYDTVDLCKKEIPLLRERLAYWGTGTGDEKVIIGKQIQILKQLIKWHDRCPNQMRMSG
ncbi:MAG: Clp protease/crotonase-like domain-containing protein, partial [Planctomycetota bacterium]